MKKVLLRLRLNHNVRTRKQLHFQDGSKEIQFNFTSNSGKDQRKILL